MGHKYVKEDETFNTSQNGVVPKPTAQEVTDNKYLRADGTWKTPPGGGGGSTVSITPTLSSGTKIADFEIDGTSGELYAPSGGSSAHNYSTNEQVVGTWIDGKPLYEKTYTDVTPNANSVGIYDIDSTKVVHNAVGRLYFQNSAIQLGAYLNSAYNSGWYQDFYSGGVLVLYYSNDYKNANYEVTVQYTKTTD